MAVTKLNYDTLDDRYFYAMADRLLNECYLLVNGKKFRLAEIEFYLKTVHHPDDYAHCNPDQLVMHAFYFHRFKNGTYKNGNYRGLDLSFGDADANAFFGILIRAICDIKTGAITEGPCNVVNRILAEYGYDNIMDFTNGENLNIFENHHDFLLVPCETLIRHRIYHGPRIGLSDKYPEYQMRKYRFVIYRNRIKKQKSKLVEI